MLTNYKSQYFGHPEPLTVILSNPLIMKNASSSDKIISICKAILFCVAFTVLFIILSFSKSYFAEKFERIAHGTIGTFAAFLTTLLFLKFDKKKFADIGLVFEKATLKKFFSVFLAGITLMGIVALSVWRDLMCCRLPGYGCIPLS
jgi:hypothetical protein